MADLDYGAASSVTLVTTMSTCLLRHKLVNVYYLITRKKKAQIAELQTFVSRFSANASKAKQATSRAKQIDKIQLDEVKASSRQNPFIRFEQSKELFRNALILEGINSRL